MAPGAPDDSPLARWTMSNKTYKCASHFFYYKLTFSLLHIIILIYKAHAFQESNSCHMHQPFYYFSDTPFTLIIPIVLE